MNPPHEFKCCRLCLCSNGRLLDLFMESNPCESDVAKAIEDLLQLKVVKEDCLRWLICHPCVARLYEFRDFKWRCLRSKLVCDSVFQAKANVLAHPSWKYMRKEVKRSKEGGFIQSGGGIPGDPLDAGNTDGLLQDIDSSSTGSDMTPLYEEPGEDGVESILEYCWCSECGKEFSSLRELKGHSQWCRAEGKPVWDSVVGVCKEEGTVDFSEGAKQQPLDPNVCCARCRKVFRTTECLIRHIHKYDFKCKAKDVDGMVNAAVESSTGNDGSEMCLVSIDHGAIYGREIQENTNTGKETKSKESNHSQNIYCTLSQKPFPTHEHLQHDAAVNDSKCRRVSSANVTSSGDGRHRKKVPSTPTHPDSISPTAQSSPSSSVFHPKEMYTSPNPCSSSGGEIYKSKKPLTRHLNKCVSDNKTKETFESGRIATIDHQDSGIQGKVEGGNLNNESDSSIVLDGNNADSRPSYKSIEMPSVTFDVSRYKGIISCFELNVSLICDYCNKPHTTKSDLRNHIVKCHLSLDPQKCLVCHRLFMNQEELEEHSLTHPRDKKFYCTICEESFLYKTLLRRHIVQSHNVRSAFICKICFNGFTSQLDLAKHYTFVHTNSEKPFKCTACGKSYINKHTYKNHINLCQLNIVQFQCDVCGKQFTTKDNLNVHSRIHLKVKKFACPMCPCVFLTSGGRNIHVRGHHLQIRNYECGICNKRFSIKSSLQKHYSSHSDERPFKCPECPKQFKLKNAITKHLRRVHLKI